MCGPVTRPITFASIPKWPSVSISVRATCSWPAVSGLAASPVDRIRKRGPGTRHSKSGSSVIDRPVAALRGEVVGESPAAGRVSSASPTRAGCLGASSSSAALELAAVRRPSRSARRLDRRRLDMGGAHDQLGGVRLGRQQRLGLRRHRRLRGARAPGPRQPRSAAAAPRAARSSSVERRSARLVPATPAPVARITPSERRAGDEDHAGDAAGTRRGSGRRASRSGARSPTARPGRRSRRAPRTRPRARTPPCGHAARAEPERAGGERQRQRRDQAQHAGAHRPARAGAAHASGPARRPSTSAAGTRVAERAEHEPRAR